MSADEIFPIVNEQGVVIGRATRKECHGGSMLLHPVVHLHVLTSDGRIYLQKRSMTKDIQPGKWDTAVGGHVDFGETVADALAREAREELRLDISGFKVERVEPYVFQSDRERELVNTFIAVVPPQTELTPDPGEIETGEFRSLTDIENSIGKGTLTPNFEQEFSRLNKKFHELTEQL